MLNFSPEFIFNEKEMLLFSIILIFLINFNHCEELNDDLIDKNGYIIFCPCMGMFELTIKCRSYLTISFVIKYDVQLKSGG